MRKNSKKRRYSAVELEKVKVERVRKEVAGQVVVFGVDIAKEVPYAALRTKSSEVLVTVKWRQPEQTHQVLDWLEALGASQLELVMESSGTYGDALRAQAHLRGMEVYQVSPKRVRDAREVYDGVPSSHDGKCAAVIGYLHQQGLSRRWQSKPEVERRLQAAMRLESYYKEQFQRASGKLEALLQRHWPELDKQMPLGSTTQLVLLQEYGSAAAVAREPKAARELMRRASRGQLQGGKLAAILESAAQTTGEVALEQEEKLVQELARDMLRAREAEKKAHQQLQQLCRREPEAARLEAVVGVTAAAALVGEAGSAEGFESVGQYEKAMGLNLVENSSGKKKSGVQISKRGSSLVRQLLCLATWRLMQRCPLARSWYERKVQRDGDKKGSRLKATVALMRKLVRGLWHVARGAEFDPHLLFNVGTPAARAA